MTFKTDAAPTGPQGESSNADSPTIIDAKTPLGGDELTPEEAAYFNSRGQKTEGLLDLGAAPAAQPDVIATRAPVTPDSAPITPAQPAPTAAADPALTPAPAADPAPTPENTVPEGEAVDFEKLQVDAEGRMRDEKGRFVPHRALHEARERFKAERSRADAAAQEARELRERIAHFEGQLSALQAKANPPAAPAAAATEPPAEQPDPAPDPETDIFGFVRWQARQIGKLQDEIKQQKEVAQRSVEEVRGQMTEQQMIAQYRTDATNFLATKPEFKDAYKHLVDARHAELALMGMSDARQRSTIIAQEERNIVQKAFELGQRPAEFIYNVAVSRGFRAPAVNPAPAPTPVVTAPVPAPAAPASVVPPVTATPAANEAAQRLANAAAAQAAAATLSGTGGSGGEGLNMEALLNMSEDEFAAVQNKYGRKGMRAFMGG